MIKHPKKKPAYFGQVSFLFCWFNMKKIIITASILLIQWTCTAQKFETIDPNELTINGVGFTEYNGDSVIPLIVSTFGQPDAKKDISMSIVMI